MGRLKDSPNYENIVKSLDFHFGRRQVLGIVTCFVAVMLYFRLRYGPKEMGICWAVCGIILGPMFLWYLIRWLEIFIKPDGYIFFTAVLDTPNLGYKRGVYYTVTGMDRAGRPIEANTRKMFSNIFSPTFEEYNNLRVLVGYNERTGRLIVVRKAIYD